MRYKTCIFDLYGTLVDIHTDEDKEELWIQMAEYYTKLGAAYSSEELKTAYKRLVLSEEAALSVQRADLEHRFPEIQLYNVFYGLFSEKNVNVSEEDVLLAARHFRKLSTDFIRLYDGARFLLTSLRRNGQKVYLLSNAQRIFTYPELLSLGIAELFDDIFISSDIGYKKPDRKFYDALIERHNIDVSKAVMVGNDGTCDIEGAKRAGLSTMYIHSDISPDEPVPSADHVLEHMDLAEAAKILLG